MYIYLDGKLNKEIILTADMIPIEVIIDVANVSQLRIEIANTTTLYDAVYGLANVTIE